MGTDERYLNANVKELCRCDIDFKTDRVWFKMVPIEIQKKVEEWKWLEQKAMGN